MNRILAIPTCVDDVVTGVYLSASPRQMIEVLKAAQIIIEDTGSESGVILDPAFKEFLGEHACSLQAHPPEIVSLSREQFLPPFEGGILNDNKFTLLKGVSEGRGM